MREPIELPDKMYLGDSVYCRVDPDGVFVLTTENGLPTDPSNKIYLEPDVYDQLALYVAHVRRAISQMREEAEKRNGRDSG
jgi:hypothetical protein